MKKYMYGVTSAGKPMTFGLSLLSSRQEEAYTIVYRDIAGVVSNHYWGDFASLNKEDKLRCLIAYQVVIEGVMKEGYSVLPVKFGTLVEGEDEIRCILEQGYKKLSQTLDRMESLVEIEVAATWDLKRVLEEIGNEAEIRRLRCSIAGKTAAEMLEMQINVGRLVKESLDRRRDDYRNRTIQFLTGMAVDIQPNTLLADEMVMNVAFLIQREKQEDFDSRVRRINEAFNDQINFRIIGPLPPYSFSMVEIRRPNLEKIEEARQLLGLVTNVSDKELKEAYRYLAAKNHPDAHLNNNASGERFAKVRQAFVLLRDYCRGQSESLEENVNGRRYSLMPKDVSQAFLVDITRPASERLDN